MPRRLLAEVERRELEPERADAPDRVDQAPVREFCVPARHEGLVHRRKRTVQLCGVEDRRRAERSGARVRRRVRVKRCVRPIARRAETKRKRLHNRLVGLAREIVANVVRVVRERAELSSALANGELEAQLVKLVEE